MGPEVASINAPLPNHIHITRKVIKNQFQLQENIQRLKIEDRSTNLGIMDLIDDAGRGEVEDTGAAINSAENGGVVEEINLEETETSFGSF